MSNKMIHSRTVKSNELSVMSNGQRTHHSREARGFTLVELIVVIAIIGFLASAVFAALSGARLDARDKKRVSDLEQVQKALNLYANDHNYFPRESDGANGNMATNETFKTMMEPYLQGALIDPSGQDSTFYYYYDGAHLCGTKTYAVIFARQLDKPENSNYDDFLNITCAGVVDGEGRGGGEESYNIIVGNSGG
jgi:general secretion pathway protein G